MTDMDSRIRNAAAMALFALAASAGAPALAQDEGSVDDVMMSVIGEEDASEQAFAEEIRLPGSGDGDEEPPDTARDAAEGGRDASSAARELRQETGERSESARDLGADAAERGSDLPDLPDLPD